MSIFEFVAVAISIVLGLGVAQLLTALLDLYRFRRKTQVHWVPVAWAIMILWLQVTFWWQLFELGHGSDTWSYGDFLLTLAIATALFAAGGLILPTSRPFENLDLWEHFLTDGKAGVAAFVAFHVLAVPFNTALYAAPIVSPGTALIGTMTALQIGVLVSHNSRVVALLTGMFAIVQVAVFIRVVQPALSG